MKIKVLLTLPLLLACAPDVHRGKDRPVADFRANCTQIRSDLPGDLYLCSTPVDRCYVYSLGTAASISCLNSEKEGKGGSK